MSNSDATFGALTLQPKTYQASTSFSRQFLAQSTIDAESFVRNDLALAHALAIDLAAINGSGASNQPLGVLKTSGIGSVALGVNGDKPRASAITDLETAIAVANADEAGMAFLTTPVMRGKLKKIGSLDSTCASMPLWERSNGRDNMLGYAAYVSNQVPSTLTKGGSSDCHVCPP